MDFTESKRQAARDFALALGVPPMLLGIPGDTTHANYQEANRAFWRHTILPLTGRTLKALSGWLGAAYGGGLELRMDLDGVEALSAEREALWARVGAASFLTDDEKRAAVGYGAGTADPSNGIDGMKRFSEQQPRVPAGQSDGGRWTSGGGSGASSALRELSSPGQSADATMQLAQNASGPDTPTGPAAQEAYRKLLDRAQTSRDSGQQLTAQDITRVDMALMAEDYVGSTRWSYSTLDPRTLVMGYPFRSNKCSLFVAQVSGWNDAGPGYPNQGSYVKHPPRSDQWADPTFAIPGWAVLGSDVTAEPGDVVAQAANYSDAFGHVMIVGTGRTFIGTDDEVDPPGIVARIPWKKDIVNPNAKKGPLVFRRFMGK